MDAELADVELADGRPVRSSGLRALYWFWALVLTGIGGGAAALQVLGPPRPHPAVAGAHGKAPEAAEHMPVPLTPVPPARAVAPPVALAHGPGPNEAPDPPARPKRVEANFPRRAAGAAIPPPDADLLAPSVPFPGTTLPRIAADGRAAMQVYAGGFDMADTRPRIALLLTGLGQHDAYSDDASRLLPAGITFAISPYANKPDRLLDDVRARGHEFLLSLPMEPQGYPVNDAGPQALLSGASPSQNMQRLEWALTRFAGYAGVTGALDGLRGERFSAMSAQMNPVLDTLASRGLMYVDAAPATLRTASIDTGRIASRAVDLVIDEPAVRTEIEQKLKQLEQIARDRGSAVGLAGPPRPVTIDRIAAWTTGLGSRGIALAPISVLMQPPAPALAPTAQLR